MPAAIAARIIERFFTACREERPQPRESNPSIVSDSESAPRRSTGAESRQFTRRTVRPVCLRRTIRERRPRAHPKSDCFRFGINLEIQNDIRIASIARLPVTERLCRMVSKNGQCARSERR